MRLAAAIVVVVPLRLPQIPTSLASAPDSKSLSATRISRMVSTWSLIFFWPFLNAYNGLPYLDSYLPLGAQKSNAMKI
jgi:hypothetical protein